MMCDWFTVLSSVDVSEHVEEKNGMRYLSWMWAWQELKKRYPLSYATVHETDDGMLVWKDPIGCHVKTSMTIVWEDDGELKEHTVTEYLPCMDYKNKSVAYDNVDSMLVNKTIQRSLTKCIARLGLGGYLFADEDLPESVAKLQEANNTNFKLATEVSKVSDAKRQAVSDLLDKYIESHDPRKIEDIETANEIYKELMKLKKSKK